MTILSREEWHRRTYYLAGSKANGISYKEVIEHDEALRAQVTQLEHALAEKDAALATANQTLLELGPKLIGLELKVNDQACELERVYGDLHLTQQNLAIAEANNKDLKWKLEKLIATPAATALQQAKEK